MEYIQSVIFSLIESVRIEKKQILKDVLILADTYGVDRSKVLLYYLRTILVSDVWSVDDIMEEVSVYKEEILANAAEAIMSISSSVYPVIDGHDKKRLAFIYDILSDCYKQIEVSKELPPEIDQNLVQRSALELATFCKIVGKECSRVSFIKSLDFKNIALLQTLNLDCFNDEVCAQINENNVEALAEMVQNLVHMYGDIVPGGLLSWKSVYTRYVMSSLITLECRAGDEMHFQSSEDINSFIDELEQSFDICKKYIRLMEYQDMLDVVRHFFTIILPIDESLRNFPCDTSGKECLVKLINLWLRLMNDVEDLVSLDSSGKRFYSECSIICLKVCLDLLVKDVVLPSQVWCTVVNYVAYGLVNSVATEVFNFCRAMIFCGCGFEAIAHVFCAIVEKFPPGTLLITTSGESSVDIQDLSKLYLSILETVLQEIAGGSPERRSLHYLLSSLSKMEGDLELLKKVRLAVWHRMSMFCDDLQLPSHIRVYSLELLQFLSGRKRDSEAFSSKGSAFLLPWEGCDDLQDITPKRENISDDPTAKDAPSRFTSTLVALKSSQLVSSVSPSLEITPDDIHSVDSAVSCFLRVSELAITASHVNALLAVLAEWEGLFTTGIDEGASLDASDAANNWANDDWDEGWESFQDESVEKETKESSILLIHPLHICWMTLISKMVALSSQTDILRLLDQSVAKNCGVLLNEDDTRSLTQTILELDCFLALKIALLLPYEAIQIQCLDAIENKLKEGGIQDDIAQDHFFFVLILSSGILSKIITKASYGTTFSYLCFMVGNLCRQFQEVQASPIRHDGATGEERNKGFLFVRLIFPCFVAELVKADQHVLAGFLAVRFMRTNASLNLINVAEASLRTYLERQVLQLQEKELSENTSIFEPLSNTVSNFKGGLGKLLQSALSLLPRDVR